MPPISLIRVQCGLNAQYRSPLWYSRGKESLYPWRFEDIVNGSAAFPVLMSAGEIMNGFFDFKEDLLLVHMSFYQVIKDMLIYVFEGSCR